jgi:hypothetical protein
MEQFLNLLGAESSPWILIFHGVSGTGSTALLGELRRSLPTGWLCLALDFQKQDYREDFEAVLGTLAEAVRATGLAPQSWAAYQRRAELVQSLKYPRVQMGMEALGNSTIERSPQIVREGKEESQRELEAMRELSSAFLDLCDEVAVRPIAFLDHWEVLLERASPSFSAWLFEDLLGRLHHWRPEFRMVIASDRPLHRDWLLRQRVRSEQVLEWEMEPCDLAGTHRKEIPVDISVVVDFFKNALSLHLPALYYGSCLVARLAVGLFKTVDFDPEQARNLLVKLGVKIKDALVPVLVEKAKAGVDALTEWLEDNKKDVEVNEASAAILVSQVEATGQALDEAELAEEKKEQTAQQVKKALEEAGGAQGEIAEDYAQALLHPDMRAVLMDKMAQGLQTWQSQSMEVRRNSMIARSKQSIDSSLPAEQRMIAEDNSAIVDSEQRVGPVKPDNTD